MKRLIYIDNFLTEHGHTPTTGTTLLRQFRKEGYTIIPSSSRKNKLLRLAAMVGTIITNRKNAVVLIATYSEAAFYFANTCAAVCRILAIPYIPCLHGGHLPGRIKRSPKMSAFYFGNSFTNVAVSGYLKQCMTQNGWKCVEIPNNIPMERYPFKKRINISPNLFWVRSFHTNYNPELAINVLYRLRQKYPEATLTMVGPDKDDNSLEKCIILTKQLNLESCVTFTGLLTQDEWIKLSPSFDIFINTSIIDNLPVSVIEAMALGMIVITTKVGGVPFLIEEGQTGLMVPAKNEEALLEAIESVLSDPQLATSLSEQAHTKAQQFDWKNVKLLWKDLFEKVSAN